MHSDFSYSDYRKNGFNTRRTRDGGFAVFMKKESTNTVLSPSAQSIIRCELGVDWVNTSVVLLERIEHMRSSSYILYCLYLIMYYSGCRVSEVLRIRAKHVISKNQVFVIASKNSENRVVTVPGIDLFAFCKYYSSDEFIFPYNRFFVYRDSIKHRFHELANGCFIDKPTKLFRYAYASMLFQKLSSVDAVAGALGHKAVDNSKYYIYQLKNNEKRSV